MDPVTAVFMARSLSGHSGYYRWVALPDTDVGFYFGAMSTRPGTLTADDLTTAEQAGTTGRRSGSFDVLIHDCELLPPSWAPDGVGHPADRFLAPVPMEELVTRIRALGDVGDFDR
jgi:hypothetical protein